ncbi:hypothetical protein LZ30DRAFT_683806 [Colletotrichum cereale]|nr:hypothetical protein LZ30DRAFT_683806 [Colletotrichum cereale]
MADSTSANDAEGAPAGGRPGGWTDAERSKKKVEWKNVSSMPNRTLKAVQGQWTSIIAQMRDLSSEDGDDAPAPKAKTPRKKPASKKKAAAAKNSENANEDSGDDQDGGETKKAATPKKRAAATNVDGTPKKRRSSAKKTAPKTELESETGIEAGTEAAVPKEENSDEQ